jgi:hypothetical protein
LLKHRGTETLTPLSGANRERASNVTFSYVAQHAEKLHPGELAAYRKE